MSDRIKNEHGIGLVEVLIALLVLLFVMMGLLQAALLSIENNIRNVLRDEAINISDTRANELKNTQFDSLVVGTTCRADSIAVTVRNAQRLYTVCDVITNIDANTRSVQVVTGWNFKNEIAAQAPTNREFQHSVTTLVRRPGS